MLFRVVKPVKYRGERIDPPEIVDVGDNIHGKIWATVQLGKRMIIPHREPGRIAPPPVALERKIKANI